MTAHFWIIVSRGVLLRAWGSFRGPPGPVVQLSQVGTGLSYIRFIIMDRVPLSITYGTPALVCKVLKLEQYIIRTQHCLTRSGRKALSIAQGHALTPIHKQHHAISSAEWLFSSSTWKALYFAETTTL